MLSARLHVEFRQEETLENLSKLSPVKIFNQISSPFPGYILYTMQGKKAAKLYNYIDKWLLSTGKKKHHLR
jgi:flagellar motility protein MotE (MotC chaperone)